MTQNQTINSEMEGSFKGMKNAALLNSSVKENFYNENVLALIIVHPHHLILHLVVLKENMYFTNCNFK